MADAVNPFTEIYTKLIQALREFDWAAARTQAQAHADLLAEADSLHATTPAVLKELLDSRVYEGVMTVADAALAVAPEQRLVRKQYAQALIDRGRIMPALDIYTKLADDLAGPLADGSETVDKELAEVCGGVGRCNKQLFLLTTDAARRSEYLSRSYSAYKHQFLNNQTRFWHGINAAAVLNFAETNGVAVAGLSDIGATKKDLAAVALAQAKEVLDAWAMATASEACVALGETEAALEWAAMFATNPDTKPFMIAAYLRQLDDMWGVKPDSLLGTTLIPLLREALVKKSGGAVIITGDDVSAERLDSLGDGSESLKMLEKVFGTDSFRPLKWWRTGLHTCRSVVRIDDDNGQPVGTGFLVDGRSLHPNWPDRVVVSNSHVIPDVLRRDDAVVAFHGLDADDVGQKEFRVDDMLWQSPLGDLDTVVLTLALKLFLIALVILINLHCLKSKGIKKGC